MAKLEGPGLWWQLLEFMGMTWPGRKDEARPEQGPPCGACHNPTVRGDDGRWRCPVHPDADVLKTP